MLSCQLIAELSSECPFCFLFQTCLDLGFSLLQAQSSSLPLSAVEAAPALQPWGSPLLSMPLHLRSRLPPPGWTESSQLGTPVLCQGSEPRPCLISGPFSLGPILLYVRSGDSYCILLQSRCLCSSLCLEPLCPVLSFLTIPFRSQPHPGVRLQLLPFSEHLECWVPPGSFNQSSISSPFSGVTLTW